MGITSASFHLAGNVLVSIEQLIISVKGPSMTGKQSFSMRALTLICQVQVIYSAVDMLQLDEPPHMSLFLDCIAHLGWG